jgi:hypothetical protein
MDVRVKKKYFEIKKRDRFNPYESVDLSRILSECETMMHRASF